MASILQRHRRLDVQLACSPCSSVGVTTYIGSGDCPNAAPFWYTGSKLGEAVDLKVRTTASMNAFQLNGWWSESTSLLEKSFICSRIGLL